MTPSPTDVLATLRTLLAMGQDDAALAVLTTAMTPAQTPRQIASGSPETDDPRQPSLALVPSGTALPARSSRDGAPSLFDAGVLAPVKQELAEKQRAGNEKRAVRRALAETVFVYWQHKLGHTRTLFDEKRQKRIMARLQENGDDASELCYAIDGLFRSGWHRENKHTGIEVVFRDRAQVEHFAEACRGYLDGDTHPHVAKTTQALTLAIAAGGAR